MGRAAGVAAIVLCASTAAAQTEPERAPVSISMAGCGELSLARVRGLVGIELDLADASAAPADTTRVAITCAGTVATIQVVDPLTGKSLGRRIDLSAPPAASTRLLSLAVVELVSASWVELVTDAPPAAPRVDVTASEPTRRAGARTVQKRLAATSWPSTLRLSLAGAGVVEGRPAFVAPGVGVLFEHDFARRLTWGADLLAAQAQEHTSLGDVRISQLTTGLVLLLRADLAGLSLEAGPGARLGVAWLEGLPAQGGGGASLAAPWAGALVAGRVVVRATRNVVVTLGGEVGWVTLSVGGRVAGTREVALEGLWAGLTLGVGLSFATHEPVSRIPPT